MKNIVIVIAIVAFVIMGWLFSLIMLYASSDEQVHAAEASYYWIGNAIAILGLMIYLRKCDSNSDSKAIK